MATYSKIEWTDNTFNPWWGCVKVSPACEHCYAESLAKRFGKKVWGPKSPRRFFGTKHWQEPLKWEEEAKRTGRRIKVFCASMADVFEDRRNLDPERDKLWKLTEATPHLDWQLLTKRPENVLKLTPWGKNWPDNVWVGCTVEDQEWANKRIPHLLKIPARIRFLSCEPLLGQVNLRNFLQSGEIHWVITGGESGPKSRPSDPDWIRLIRDDCVDAGVAFFFKQWGAYAPAANHPDIEKPAVQVGATQMVRLNKKSAGRVLDGGTWEQFPK